MGWPHRLCVALVLALRSLSAYSRQLKIRHTKSRQGPLDGFHPEDVLCKLGDRVFPWCVDWVQCIARKAQPSGTPEAVMKAWQPATCEEICGVWPPPLPPTTTITTTTTMTTTPKPTTTAAKKPERAECPDWWDPADGDCNEVLEEVEGEMEGEIEEEIKGEMEGKKDDKVKEKIEGEMEGEKADEEKKPENSECPDWWDPADGDCNDFSQDEIQGEECPDWWDPADGDCNEAMEEMELLFKQRKPSNYSFLSISKLASRRNVINKNSCMVSCENMFNNFATCVSTIVFEPGKLSNMGMPSRKGLRTKPPAICTMKDTPCMPNLAVRHQKCLHHRTSSVLNPSYHVPEEDHEMCHYIEKDFDECRDCPQLSEEYMTQYAAFTGGCMEQMHAYRRATGPQEPDVGVPRESGQCTLQG